MVNPIHLPSGGVDVFTAPPPSRKAQARGGVLLENYISQNPTRPTHLPLGVGRAESTARGGAERPEIVLLVSFWEEFVLKEILGSPGKVGHLSLFGITLPSAPLRVPSA